MDEIRSAAGHAPGTAERDANGGSAPRHGGNPNARPRRARHETMMAVDAVLDDAAERLVRAVVEKALAGDTAALRFCVERLWPLPRDAAVEVDLPRIAAAAPAIGGAHAVLAACAAGILPPRAAIDAIDAIDEARKRRHAELDARLTALEKRRGR